MIKKYWDIICGTIMGVIMIILSHLETYIIQLCYSIVLLILANIAVFRLIKQSIEKKAKKREYNIIDSMVDNLKPIKAIKIAQNPKDGEVLIKLILGGLKKTMKKIKEFFDKYKGYMLTIALGSLTLVETYGGFINELAGGVLVIKGVEVVPIATLALTVVVGLLSNGFTKEQMEKIKELLVTLKPVATNKLVVTDIKKTIKEDKSKLKDLNKVKSACKAELDNLERELDSNKDTLSAKVEMQSMTPQLATVEDVQFAEMAVREVEVKIEAKKQEITDVEASISNLTSEIDALKSRL